MPWGCFSQQKKLLGFFRRRRAQMAQQVSPCCLDTAVSRSAWVWMKTRKPTMRLSRVAALLLIVGANVVALPLARAASDCSASVTLADWGENSTGYIEIASGGSCLFPIRMRGTVSGSDISQKPIHGKLKRHDTSTYEYTAKARYKGTDTFAIKATGKGPTASGTSVITVHATIK